MNLLELDMFGNYEQRAVKRFVDEDRKIIVDTCYVTDGEYPYETGVKHPEYNNGKWIIVAAYPTREIAEERHDRWVELMTSDNPPDELVDCQNLFISKLCSDLIYKRERKCFLSKIIQVLLQRL